MTNQVRLNHELLLWRGFTLTNGVWSYPEGVTVDNGVPYFPESLDEIFKWLVPKLQFRSFTFEEMGEEWVCEILPDAKTMGAKTPALALCLAIQKLISSK